MENTPSAFLIMPFDEEFDSVYVGFIKPVLEGVGFKVVRADNIQEQQSILKAVIEGISKSNLIVADLTTNNPNVFYELGLAHALRKPVILVTQSIEEVPFDLKSYRLLEYSTHFHKINEAKRKLTEFAEGFLQGKVQFGSPITDFLQDGAVPSQAIATVPYNAADEDERGFIDHLIDINDGYTSIAKIITDLTSDLQGLSRDMEMATNELTRISANPNDSSPAAVRTVSRRLANRVENFNYLLKQANDKYTSIAQGTEDSLEFVVTFQLEQSEVTDPAVDEQISSLRDLQSVAIVGRDSFLALAKTMEELPRLERRLSREVARGSEGIRVMAGNIDKTIASISRALKHHA